MKELAFVVSVTVTVPDALTDAGTVHDPSGMLPVQVRFTGPGNPPTRVRVNDGAGLGDAPGAALAVRLEGVIVNCHPVPDKLTTLFTPPAAIVKVAAIGFAVALAGVNVTLYMQVVVAGIDVAVHALPVVSAAA